MGNERKKRLIDMAFYDDGSFDLFYPGSEKKPEEIPPERFTKMINEVDVTETIATPHITIMKTNSGFVNVGGRLVWMP